MQQTVQCKQCGHGATNKYCDMCGQALATTRITLHSIVHEVFHFFTHLDKGFPHTLKKLVSSPGAMQLAYIKGERNRHQKPFSMFFLSATIAALIYYWINTAVKKYYDAGSEAEVSFFNHYMVLLQVCLLPLYSFITWLVFRKAGYNYAEITVLQLYTFAIVILLAAIIQSLKFFFPHIETRFIELPLIILYVFITNINFFKNMKRWQVLLLTILSTGISFAIANGVKDVLVKTLF